MANQARLTKKQIFDEYPNQWVYIIDAEICEQTGSIISGIVLANSDSRQEMFRISEYHDGNAAIRFTGQNPNPKSQDVQSFVSISLKS